MEGDRIEHGAVVPLELIGRLRDLGLTVVTQPGFVAERGDEYLADVDPADRPDLWRCGSLLAAGVAVGAGTDAPFGSADPWRAVAAAIDRRTEGGAMLGTRRADRGRGGARPLPGAAGPARAVRPGGWWRGRRPICACWARRWRRCWRRRPPRWWRRPSPAGG